LLHRARGRDRAALAELIATKYHTMLAFAQALVGVRAGQSAVPADVANEAALRLLKVTHISCESELHFENYLRAVVRNQFLSYLRTRSAKKRCATGVRVDLDVAMPGVVDQRHTEGTLMVIVGEMAHDDDVFKMIQMHYFQEQDVPSIARYFGVSVSAVYRSLKKGKETLRALLAPDPSTHARASNGAPRCIDHYRVERELGRGANGIVYRVIDAATDQPYAMKILSTSAVSRRTHWRFAHEIEILQRLNSPGHAGVARFRHSGRAGSENPNATDSWCYGQPYYVMQNIEGITLKRFLEDSSKSMSDRLRVFARLCRAAEYLHLREVVHRDLKPANVLVNDDGQPTIIDYGIAIDGRCRSSLLRDERGFIGTMSYAAPEQREGRMAQLGVATDVYALGVILHEMLTGKPYAGVRLNKTLASMAVDPSIGRNGETAQFRYYLTAVLATALARSPSSRFRHAGAFGERIELLLDRYDRRARYSLSDLVSSRQADETPLHVALHREIALARIAGHLH